MNWSQELETVVRTNTPRSNRGTSCCFMQLTPTTGIKLYATKLERDASYVALSVAAEHGLAPQVGQCIELVDLKLTLDQRPRWWDENCNPKVLYGFLTEYVQVGEEHLTRDELRNLKHQLNTLFDYEVCDIGVYNVGRDSQDRAVAIDLDGRWTGLLTEEDMDRVSDVWGKGLFYA